MLTTQQQRAMARNSLVRLVIVKRGKRLFVKAGAERKWLRFREVIRAGKPRVVFHRRAKLIRR